MSNVKFYTIPNSLVVEKRVKDGKTTWSLLNKSSHSGDSIDLDQEYVDFTLEVPCSRTFMNLKDMMIVRGKEKVVFMFRKMAAIMDSSTWNLFLNTIVEAQRGLRKPCARSAKSS